MARDAVAEWVDAVELWAEDQDYEAAENLDECTRYIFEDVPRLALSVVLWWGR